MRLSRLVSPGESAPRGALRRRDRHLGRSFGVWPGSRARRRDAGPGRAGRFRRVARDSRPGELPAASGAASRRARRRVAEVAWVVATACQAQGYAREAAGAMVAWFRCQGVTTVVAHVHPDHRASSAVAAAVGLSPTTLMEEGEARWEGRAALDPPVGLTCHAITVVLRWSGAVSTRPAVNGIG
ncbi:MAG: GNAT family N-acetyltransferase [Actinomycetes bacterium]